MRRPYGIGEDENAVDVIGHHHKPVQGHVGKMVWDLLPTSLGDASQVVQGHLSILNIPK
jgi:hypothetical protein